MNPNQDLIDRLEAVKRQVSQLGVAQLEAMLKSCAPDGCHCSGQFEHRKRILELWAATYDIASG